MSNIFASWTQGPDIPIPSDVYVTDNLNAAVKIRYENKNELKYPPLSIYTLLKNIVDQKPAHPAHCTLKSDGTFETLSYGEFWNQTVQATKSLIKLGVDQISCVSIYSSNSSKFLIAEYGIIFSGAVYTGFSFTYSIESIQYYSCEAGCTIMFVQDAEYLDRILSNGSMKFKMLIQMNGKLEERHKNCNNLMDWDTFMNVGLLVDDNEFQNRIKTIAPNKCAVLVYTSGTTGFTPKAAMLSHDNLTYSVRTFKTQAKTFQERFIAIAGFPQISGQFTYQLAVSTGGTYYFVGPILPDNRLNYFQLIKPTIQFGSPLEWRFIKESYEKKKETFNKSLTIREQIGLGDCHAPYIGGTIAPQHLVDYFKSIGITFLNMYGSTEACLFSSTDEEFSTMCIDNDNKISFKIGYDSELLCNGRFLFMGYLKSETKNKASFDINNWFKTGDMAKIDQDCRITIIGRIKEQLMVGPGAPVSPVWIEDAIKAELDCISQCMLVGDNELYIIALITLKCKRVNGEPIDELEEDVVKLLKSYDLNITKASDASKIDKNHPFMRWLDEKIKIANKKSEMLAIPNTVFAQVKKFAILPRDFTQSKGDLGILGKMCRSKIVSNFKDIIDDLYDRNSNRNQ